MFKKVLALWGVCRAHSGLCGQHIQTLSEAVSFVGTLLSNLPNWDALIAEIPEE